MKNWYTIEDMQSISSIVAYPERVLPRRYFLFVTVESSQSVRSIALQENK